MTPGQHLGSRVLGGAQPLPLTHRVCPPLDSGCLTAKAPSGDRHNIWEGSGVIQMELEFIQAISNASGLRMDLNHLSDPIPTSPPPYPSRWVVACLPRDQAL